MDSSLFCHFKRMCKLIKSLSQYSFKFVESDEDLPKFPRGFVGIT